MKVCHEGRLSFMKEDFVGLCKPILVLDMRRLSSEQGLATVSNVLLECVFKHLEDPNDRKAVSEVCKLWHSVDSITRKHVEIPFCYSVLPSSLTRRFKYLDSVKIKGKPRAYEFDLLPENWGGYVEPWVNEIVQAYPAMSKLHFKRMEVTDEDLANLAHRLGNSLQVLKLDKCIGFSTHGLLDIACHCRHLKVLYLEESPVIDNGGEWLHELAQRKSCLEVLNFAMTGLETTNIGDLEMIIENCESLSSLKVGEIDAISIKKVLSKAKVLQDFSMCNSNLEGLATEFELPKTLNSLSGDIFLPLSPIVASNIRKLDLKATSLSAEHHLQVLRCCINLEVLEVRNIIGDAGMALLANNCKKLQRLRVERADRDDHGIMSHNSLISLAQNCTYLKFLVLHISDITNAALTAFGQFCPFLVDFRLVLIDNNEIFSELPLDNGILAVMKGCEHLTRICLYLRHGGLTDMGLGYIGRYGGKLKWALLGCLGETDLGLEYFALGCQKLEKLEIRDCPFSEAAISVAVNTMKLLKYIWVEGYSPSETCVGFKAMRRAYWNMEYFYGSEMYVKQLLAYYSLAGVRFDRPDVIISLGP